MRLLLTTLLLTGCLPMTYAAKVRLMGGARLTVCIETYGCSENEQNYCYDKARAFCRDAGLEVGCAFGEAEQRTPCVGQTIYDLVSDGGTRP